MKHNVIWSPQPRQAAFMARPEYEALYGGAAGGGKSDALVMEALRQVHIPHYKALILRKTFPQLAELQDKAEGYYPRAFPGAKFNASTHTWRFPSGARVVFGAMQHPGDRVKYQGQAFDLIAFDELTHFTWEEYAYMFSRNRPNGPGTRVYIRATANPGGVGHGWVKSRFITAGVGGTDGKCYYLSAKRGQETELLCYDIRLGLWTRRGPGGVLAFARGEEGLLCLRESCLSTLEAGQGVGAWLGELAPLYESLDRVQYRALRLRAHLEPGSCLKVEARYDGGAWQRLGWLHAGGHRVAQLTMPVRRCGVLQLRLSGRGDCTVLELERQYRRRGRG